MTTLLRTIFGELVGLFVEDWPFALAIALWLAAMGAVAAFDLGDLRLRGPTLFVGLATILLAEVLRASRRA